MHAARWSMHPAVVVLAFGILASSCSAGPARHARYTGYDQYEGKGGKIAYLRAVERWSEEIRLYDAWETSLLLKAVYKSETFRRAYSHEYARRYILPRDDYGLLLDRELAESARFHQVLFAVWADDTRHGDFVGTNPPWKVRLVGDDDRTVDPLNIRHIRKPTTEMLSLFPMITAHDQVFVANFPVLGADGLPLLAPDSAQLKMQVVGVLNRGELIWRLGPN